MKNFLVLLILITLGYFGYQSFIQSDVVNQESVRDRTLRENDLDDLESSLPKGAQDALIETKKESDNFLTQIQEKINEWRIVINEKI